MPLQRGARLGHYEVVSALGAGGMGEVWRARDTRLGRDVALKVLPAAFVADPERLARFEREAKVLASLNHPHIAGIYGLEEADASAGAAKALVLELVEGPTLADRIARGPIPLEEALPIARQIAEALEAAHEQGIVHRDLKPANIKVRPDGTVKVLDFGLAKVFDPQLETAQAGDSHSPTLSLPAAATRTGVLLGTAAYMAPEQARGRTVDKRADIWAFGCVLYEMLCGRRAFAGADLSETLARVLEREPDWSALPASAPRGVVRVLKRSLRRDRDDRLHDIADARIEIAEVASGAAVEGVTVSPPRRRDQVLVGAALVAAMVLGAAVAVFTSARWRAAPRPSSPVTFSIPTPHGGRVRVGSSPPALSPDGKQIAFYALNESGASVLWVRSLDALVPRELPGTGFTWAPFWSPDGDAVAFANFGGLMRVDLAGGPPQKITDFAQPVSGTWSRTGDIVFWSMGGKGLLQRVAATGGPVTPATTLSEERREVAHAYPHFLPDGRRFLYLAWSRDDRYTGLYVGSLDGGEATFVAPLASRAEYADGYLVFGSGSDLFAQPFDLDTLKLAGDRSRIGERVGNAWPSFHNFDFATAPGGVMAYRPGSFWLRRGQLVLTDAAGDVVQNLGPPYRTLSMALSPDSKRLALEVANAENKSADIWIMDVPGASVSRLTSFAGAMRTFSVPVWSPSGDRVLATSFTGQLWVSRPDRPNAPTQPLTHELDGAGGFPTDWSPDGRYVVVDQWDATTQTDIWLLPTDPEGTPEEYAKTRYFEGGGRVSPDGNWLAYTSHESGRPLIFLDTFPQPTSRIVVTSASGEWPRWSTDGRALYYIGPESTVMRASLSLEGDRPQVADPETLFHLTSGFAVNDISRSPYEVLGDGEQFIFNQEIPEENPDTITVVVNWPAALKR